MFSATNMASSDTKRGNEDLGTNMTRFREAMARADPMARKRSWFVRAEVGLKT